MPLYFFDLYNDVNALDEEGKALPDLSAVRDNALCEVREMMSESVLHGELNLNHRIEVRDEGGEVIYVLSFGDALTIIQSTGNA